MILTKMTPTSNKRYRGTPIKAILKTSGVDVTTAATMAMSKSLLEMLIAVKILFPYPRRSEDINLIPIVIFVIFLRPLIPLLFFYPFSET